MTKTSKMHQGVTIGLDLGDRHSDLCVMDATGEVIARPRVATTPRGLPTAFAPYAGARVILEVGTHSPWVSRLLTAHGHEVIVANPGHVRRIAGVTNKSDRLDAELLARLGRVDPQLLRPIQHRGAGVQRARAVLRTRDQFVRMRARIVTHARGLAKALGTRLPQCDVEQFAKRVASGEWDDAVPGLAQVREVVCMLTQQIRILDRAITCLARDQYPVTAQLDQVCGVGPITALAYVVTLEDPHRFRRSRDVGPYVGLRPKRYQSGQRDPELGISKTGDAFLRRTLVQAAHYILGPFGPDTALRRFGLRLLARGGRAAHKRAVVAVARKLAVLLHRRWVTGERYEPLRGIAPSTAA